MKKGYLDKNSLKIGGHLSFLRKDYNELNSKYNKKSVEEFLILRAVKPIVQILQDSGLF